MTTDSKVILGNIFDSIRKEFDRRYQIKDPDATDPDTIAFQKAVHSLCCPVSGLVMRLPSAIRFWQTDNCDVVSFIRLDLEKQGTQGWEFLGEHSAQRLVGQREELRALFLSDPDLDTVQSLTSGTLLGTSNRTPDWIMWAIPGDIRTAPQLDAYLIIEALMFDYQERIVSRAKTKLDFEKHYGLTPPSPRSALEILTAHSLGGFDPARLDTSAFEPLVARARSVDSILLIPKVPTEVSTTFEIARELYIYSAFHHWLGTPACHYLYLALEAAIKHRWCATLKKPILVTNKKGAQVTLVKPRHQDFFELKAKNGGEKAWGHRNILVNGRKFTSSTEGLVDDLLNLGILSKWQLMRLKSGLRLRNIYSHREFSTIFPAGIDRIREVGRDLNLLFHSL